MRRRLSSQDGFSIVIAVVLLGFMMSAGLASYAYVDTGQNQSRVERVDESAFNLGEGILNAQAFFLSRHWPRTPARQYPPCTQASAPATFCPQPATIEATFDSVDFRTGQPTWSTSVRDDTGSEFYDQQLVDARPTYDANGNDKVWVRASATYTVGAQAGRTRVLVALIQIERVQSGLQFPARTIVAGKFSTTNDGNKILIDTKSTQTSPHNVTLRCAPVDPPSASCADYEDDKGQLSPSDAIESGYQDQDALPVDTQNALREKALADDTYYTSTCPSSFSGEVVWVETATCTIDSDTNSATAPGIVIFGSGKMTISSNRSFYGVIYMLNNSNLTDADVVKLHANTEVTGRIFIDGPGGIEVGSSKLNLIYEDFLNIPQAFSTFGTAGVVQNSWREVLDVDD